MLSYRAFVQLVRGAVPRFSGQWLNAEQDAAVRADPAPPAVIVAGPGAGKTTVLVLRVLKLIFVDGLRPEQIIATTFTRKAALELRSRLLSWGYAVWHAACQNARGANRTWVESLDLNQALIGTLDSLAESFLRDHRPPGTIVPVTVEPFLARAVLRRVFFQHGHHNDTTLATHLSALHPQFPQPTRLGGKLDVTLGFADRLLHDVLDTTAYSAKGRGQRKLVAVINDYFVELKARSFADFASLEQRLFDAIGGGHLSAVTGNLKAVLVDEFQDTNYLQEQIYLSLCQASGCSLTVVGDDDQSIYRFRGATVEIFANFEQRIVARLGASWQPTRHDLFRNYRSSGTIVSFCHHFITVDAGFQAARAPGKQTLIAAARHAGQPAHELPILGLFRDDLDSLADGVSSLLLDIFRNGGRRIRFADGREEAIQPGAGGDVGDAVLLARSVRETNYQGKERLPLLVRRELASHGIQVFNPRGRALGSIPSVRSLLGIALECIDPHGQVQNAITGLPQEVSGALNGWRQDALQFVATNPAPPGLQSFVSNWQRRPRQVGSRKDYPLLELIFAIVTWLPELQTQPEGQVYLEAVARAIATSGQSSSFGSRLVFQPAQLEEKSVKQAIWECFVPLAGDEVEVDEDIMPQVPRSYFPMMTIHQAKGLEFPLVIVDVGSDFRGDYVAQRGARFPERGEHVHTVEDEIAACCPVGASRVTRGDIDRAWDDLRRLYFVAYSRSEMILVLCGLTSMVRLPAAKGGKPALRSLALGDLRTGPRSLAFVPAAQWRASDPATTVALI